MGGGGLGAISSFGNLMVKVNEDKYISLRYLDDLHEPSLSRGVTNNLASTSGFGSMTIPSTHTVKKSSVVPIKLLSQIGLHAARKCGT